MSEPMHRKKPGGPKGKRNHNMLPTVILQKDRNKGGRPSTGGLQRANAYELRANQLAQKCYPHAEIAAMIQREFNLERTPSLRTISAWLSAGDEMQQEEIRDIRLQLRYSKFDELQSAIDAMMPILTRDDISIARKEMVNGETQIVLDEEKVKEKIGAAKALAPIIREQIRLMDLAAEKPSESSQEGPSSLQELHLWIIQQSHQKPEENPAIDVQAEVLELETGLEDSL